MSEWKRRKKEQDWTEDAEHSEAQDEGYEKTYRDGSAVNECWAEDKANV